MSRPFEKIIIVGAGSAGLLPALMLSSQDIPVHVVDDLRRAGVLDKIRQRGYPPTVFSWRRFGDDYEAWSTWSHKVMSNVDGEDLRTACLPLNELLGLLLEEIRDRPGVNISGEHKVLGADQGKDKAWVDVETSEGVSRLKVDYVVGCDGAHSQVRKSMFGDNFPGFTWDVQPCSTDTYYDLQGKFGFADANFIMDPENFFVAAKLTRDGLFRITYGERADMTKEEVEERLPGKFEALLPGNPKARGYEIKNWAPHKIHQRCAPSFRVGRLLLAADAAHVCNPFGGLGITGGFVNVSGLYDCLAGIWYGKADPSILDIYSEKRKEIWYNVIDAVSQKNFRRVTERDPQGNPPKEQWEMFVSGVDNDPELRKKLLMQRLGIRYDFTQHYTSHESRL